MLCYAQTAAAENVLHSEHVIRSSSALYIVVLHRYAELIEYCNATKTPWPLESTMRDTFNVLRMGVNMTEHAYGAAVVVCLLASHQHN